MKTYSEKLKDPRWQRKRLEVLQRANFECMDCCAGDITLQVHHLYYVSGREPWEYPDFALRCLCSICHGNHHRTKKSEHLDFEVIAENLAIQESEDFCFLHDLSGLIQSGIRRLGKSHFESWVMHTLQDHIENQGSIH
jgi:hypothetical protein